MLMTHLPIISGSTNRKLTAAEELCGVGHVKFVDLLIDLVRRKAGGSHAIAHFISLVRVNRCRGIPINEHPDIGSRSHQPILVHASL